MADGLAGLLADQSWYQLLIPAEELACDSFEKIRLWEEIALSLLKKYTERYYTFRKREWELPHLEYQELTADDPNFPKGKDEDGEGYYRILLDRSQEEIVAKLTELKTLIEAGNLKPWEFSGMKAIWFGRHLYEPLLYLDQNIVEISPVPLNKGERNLVEDLKAFHDGAPEFFADKELYLLRNLSKGRGVGFFEAENFHPDFILWLIVADRQFISFIDPKGIRNLGFSDPKIQFFQTIKDIERRLPVDRDNPLAGLGKPPHEADEPGMKPIRIKQPKHPAERIVARNTVFQPQKFLQKLQLRPAEQRHVRTGLSAAQQRAKPNYQRSHAAHAVLRVSRPRVFQILENLLELLHGTASSALGAIR